MICSRCGNICLDNQSYCANCGNNLKTSSQSFQNQSNNTQQYVNQPVNNNLNNQMVNNYENNINNQPINYYPNYGGYNNQGIIEKKNNITLYICCGIILIALIIVVALIANKGKNKVYFNHEDQEISENSNTSITSTTRNSYETVIKTDNIYFMTIESDAEAYEEIRKDSVSQKSTCPKEVIEIENRIINNYGITGVNLCEIDVEYAKEIEQVIKHVYYEFPSARGYLTNFSLVNVDDSQGYIACFMGMSRFILPEDSSYPIVSKTSILLNAKYFLNIDYMNRVMTSSSNSGHFPPNTTKSSSVAHEFAHYLSFVATLKKHNVDSVLIYDEQKFSSIYDILVDWNQGSNSLDIIQTAYKNYQVNYNDQTTTFDQFRASISQYAVAKDNQGEYIYDETIAEAYHDYFLNGDNAKPASKEVVAELKRRLG